MLMRYSLLPHSILIFISARALDIWPYNKLSIFLICEKKIIDFSLSTSKKPSSLTNHYWNQPQVQVPALAWNPLLKAFPPPMKETNIKTKTWTIPRLRQRHDLNQINNQKPKNKPMTKTKTRTRTIQGPIKRTSVQVQVQDQDQDQNQDWD